MSQINDLIRAIRRWKTARKKCTTKNSNLDDWREMLNSAKDLEAIELEIAETELADLQRQVD
jgi:hypothetical protein